MSPRFSLIVPVYNRAGMIARALDSALSQGFTDFELVVVDDGSVDGTAERVRAYADPRVRLVALPRNRGVCAARNAGIDVALGEWCVMLDSDFTLLPGGLARLSALCDLAAPSVVNVATACEWDDGSTTPDPAPEGDLDLDHEGWVRWMGTLRTPEYFNCVRRSALARVRYPEYRAYEGCFHLALSRLGRFTLSLTPVAKVHTDANNRVTAAPPAGLARRLLRDALDGAVDADNQLRTAGDVLRSAAPRTHRELQARSLELHLLAGDRVGAALSLLRRREGLRGQRELSTVALGALSPRLLAGARGLWRHRGSLDLASVVDVAKALTAPVGRSAA